MSVLDEGWMFYSKKKIHAYIDQVFSWDNSYQGRQWFDKVGELLSKKYNREQQLKKVSFSFVYTE